VDRSRERLGTSDRGIIQLRKMYLSAIQAVQEGREPKGVIRDAARHRVIRLPRTNQIGRTDAELAVSFMEP
jgi:5,5'-dehydrodivanillate O-demethylase